MSAAHCDSVTNDLKVTLPKFADNQANILAGCCKIDDVNVRNMALPVGYVADLAGPFRRGLLFAPMRDIGTRNNSGLCAVAHLTAHMHIDFRARSSTNVYVWLRLKAMQSLGALLGASIDFDEINGLMPQFTLEHLANRVSQ